jgi:hypothetical protein
MGGGPVEPHVDPTSAEVFKRLQTLAVAADEDIARWVDEFGLVGVHPDTPSRGETTADIREAVAHYVACARSLEAAQQDTSKLGAALQLLQQPISRYLTVRAVISEAGGRARLLPVIASRGHLAAAYQQLLGSASLEDAVTRQRYHWRQPRPCDQCGTWYRPRRRGQAFCKANCRKRHHDERRGA